MQRPLNQSFLIRLKYKLAPWVGYYLINFLIKTVPMERLDESKIEWTAADPCLLVCWHSDLLFVPVGFRQVSKNLISHPILALASRHGDGRVVAQILEKFGIKGVAGSSNDGAMAALMQMKNRLRTGFHIAVAPDGPRGPAKVPKPGVVYLSSTCNAQIIPFTIACTSQWTLRSWDRFFIPKPFSRAISIIGEPINVPPNLKKKDLLHYNELLKCRLDELKERAESLLESGGLKRS